MSDEKKTLYERLGGYDAIAASANDLLLRLQADPRQLAHVAGGDALVSIAGVARVGSGLPTVESHQTAMSLSARPENSSSLYWVTNYRHCYRH